jgi:hypothetical protein
MAVSFKLWNDVAMTDEFIYISDKIVADISGDFTLYLGTNTANRQLQAYSDPGVDQITITPTDSNPGAGHEATEIKLATTQVGLDSAVAGDPLNLGTTLAAQTAYPIWIRLTDATGGPVPSTELSLVFNTVVEYSV